MNSQPHRITISRLSAVDGGHSWEETATDQPCMIQPMSAFRAQQIGLAYGQAFRLWARPTVDLQTGDTLTDQDGTKYKVKEMEPHANYGSAGLRHNMFVITKETEE